MSISDMSLLDLLLEMKDTSELMVSLAYSALLYDNKDIASEVLYLEEDMDHMYTLIKKNAVESCSEGGVGSAVVYLQMAESMETISDAALQIADVVLRDMDMHPVMQMSIMDSDTAISAGRIETASVLCDAKLGEATLASETGMWILAVRRERQWKFGPDEDTTLRAGDVIIAEGPSESIPKFRAVLSGEESL